MMLEKKTDFVAEYTKREKKKKNEEKMKLWFGTKEEYI